MKERFGLREDQVRFGWLWQSALVWLWQSSSMRRRLPPLQLRRGKRGVLLLRGAGLHPAMDAFDCTVRSVLPLVPVDAAVACRRRPVCMPATVCTA